MDTAEYLFLCLWYASVLKCCLEQTANWHRNRSGNLGRSLTGTRHGLAFLRNGAAEYLALSE